MRRLLLAALVAAPTLLACAPDENDAYTADAAPPATRAPIEEPAEPDTPEEPDAPDAPDSPDEPDAPEVFPPNGETVTVKSLDNSFRPETIEVVAGTEVSWTNDGRNDHNVLPTDDAADWGVGEDEFVPGAEYARVFDTPGVYPYYCSIHGTKDVGMIGTVVVVAP